MVENAPETLYIVRNNCETMMQNTVAANLTPKELIRLNAVFNSLNDFKELFPVGGIQVLPHVMHLTNPVAGEKNQNHMHRVYEYSLLLDGEMIYTVEPGVEIALGAGDAVVIPAGTRHHWRLAAPRVLVFGFMFHIVCRDEAARTAQRQFADAVIRAGYRIAGFALFAEIVEEIIRAVRNNAGYLEEKLRSLSQQALLELFSILLPAGKHSPNPQGDSGLPGRDSRQLVEAVKFFVNDNSYRPLTPGEVSRHVGVGLNQLNATLKRHCGRTAGQIIWDRKMTLGCQLLNSTNRQVKDIAASLGIEDPAYFCRRFKQSKGISPAEFRRENRS